MEVITMENFQSVREKQVVPVNGITLLYGNNSSGKSIIKDALEVFSGMGVGPENHRPKEEWVNVKGGVRAGKIRLGCGFFLKDILRWETAIGEYVYFDILDVSLESTEAELESDSVTCLDRYLSDSFIHVEYEWSGEGPNSSEIYDDYKAVISLARAEAQGGTEMDVFAEIYDGDGGGKTISFNKDHELIKLLGEYLSCSPFIGGEDIGMFNLEYSGFDGLESVHERYRLIQKSNVGINIGDIGFVLTLLCMRGVHSAVSKAARYKYVGDVRESSEQKNGDAYSGAAYWNGLKHLVLERHLGGDRHDGALDRVNKWLCDENYLNSGYTLTADFKFLVGLDELEYIQEGGLDAILSRAKEDAFHGRTTADDGLCYSQLRLMDERTGKSIDFSDVGTGISQVIPILYFMSGSWIYGSYTYIQQPELHLHPKLQAAMAQIFVESFVTNDKSLNFIIETHSELIVLRMLKIIRKNYETENLLKKRALLAEDINVIFAVKDRQGVTTYKTIRVSKDGDFLDKWPEGFFEERDRELFW